MGDFNKTLSSSEHSLGTNPRYQSGMRDFQAVVSSCNLVDMAAVGWTFTWINNQSTNPIAKKLVRVLVNDIWISQFSQFYAQYEPSGVSDHVRCRVFLETPTEGKKCPFKFVNYLTEHLDFSAVVSETWNASEPLFHSRSALFLFHRKLKNLKSALRLQNKTRFGNIPCRAKEAFLNLCEKQEQPLSHPDSSSFESVAAALNDWNY